MPHYGEMVSKNVITLKTRHTALENVSFPEIREKINNYYNMN